MTKRLIILATFLLLVGCATAPEPPPGRMPSSTTRGGEPFGHTLMCRREPDHPLCREIEQ